MSLLTMLQKTSRTILRGIILILCASSVCSNDLQDIQKFSQEKRGKVLPMRWEPHFDFIERMDQARHVNGPDTAVRTETIGDLTIPFISQHPNLDVHGPLSRLDFPEFEAPVVSEGEKLIFHFYTAISPAARMETVPGADGVEFRLLINQQPLFAHRMQTSGIEEWAIDLSPYTGQGVQFTFITDPSGNSQADWALWGQPRVLIEGRKARLKEGPKSRWLSIKEIEALPKPERVLRSTSTTQGFSGVLVMDEGLDLATDLWRTSSQAGKSLTPQPPPLIVGEGADPENHTLVRILNHWGIAEYQFLAYPPEVMGGVQVHAINMPEADGRIAPFILTAPISDETISELRLFSIHAINAGAIQVVNVPPPFQLAVGNFDAESFGDEIALASRQKGFRRLLILNSRGDVLKDLEIPKHRGEFSLTRTKGKDCDDVAFLDAEAGQIFRMDARSGNTKEISLGSPSKGNRISEAGFEGQDFWISGEDSEFAMVQTVLSDARTQSLNIGERENRFYYQWYSDEEKQRRDNPGMARKHIKSSRFEHLRMDLASSGLQNPDFSRTDSEYWAGESFRARVRPHFEGYNQGLPAMWEPCFTHRQPGEAFKEWMLQKDPDSSLPLYSMLNRNNKTADYSEFGSSHFQMSSYAFGHSALDCLYLYPLREFLRNLAVCYRGNPEHIVGVEPNHEHEIAVESEGTIGDYNLAMIRGYAKYLQSLYGGGMTALNRHFNTGFGEYFDAPRNWERGDWDMYSNENPYFQNWIDYNRYVVNRRIAMTLREGLLAGFPPELLKTHQIPDTYAIGNLSAFSDVVARLTPIDYLLNAGTGYGITHYGLWYNRDHNAIQGANSSGFDQVSIGEYQALVPETEQAWNQVKYMFEHGVYSIHCMMWPQGHDKGFNASMEEAIARLLKEDPPRPGMTGGVGQVRAFKGSTDGCHIASIGIGPESTGLLKSVRADGTAEGSVYVVPFHSHVDISVVEERENLPVEATPIVLGPYEKLDSGEQFEICFDCSGEGKSLTFEVCGANGPLDGLSFQAPVKKEQSSFRILFRNQLPVQGVSFQIRNEDGLEKIHIANLKIYRQSEQTAKLTKGVFTGKRHRGGVEFDILPEDCGL